MKKINWLVMALAIVAVALGTVGCGDAYVNHKMGYHNQLANGQVAAAYVGTQTAPPINGFETHEAGYSFHLNPLHWFDKLFEFNYNEVVVNRGGGCVGRPNQFNQQITGGRHVEVIGGQQYPVRDGYHAIIQNGQVFETPNLQ